MSGTLVNEDFTKHIFLAIFGIFFFRKSIHQNALSD